MDQVKLCKTIELNWSIFLIFCGLPPAHMFPAVVIRCWRSLSGSLCWDRAFDQGWSCPTVTDQSDEWWTSCNAEMGRSLRTIVRIAFLDCYSVPGNQAQTSQVCHRSWRLGFLVLLLNHLWRTSSPQFVALEKYLYLICPFHFHFPDPLWQPTRAFAS